ncbi:MAG: hypothetical protein K9H49_07165 [Bacteroidales bacterium]|nr:hypothetical protein [Bacteroidales bacterium]
MKKKDTINEDSLIYSRENSFVVPEGYFDTFSTRLNKRILLEQEAASEKKTFNLKSFLNHKLAVAASLLIIITVSYFTVNIILNHNKTVSQNYAAYIENSIDDFDLALLADFYDEDEFTDQSDFFSEEDQDIIDFLISEDIDIELIIEEL